MNAFAFSERADLMRRLQKEPISIFEEAKCVKH
jgi:hypothetical protein